MILDLFGQPWAITENGLKTIINVASRDTFFSDVRKQALEARDGEPLKNTRAVKMHGSVAVIPVVGPLIRHADMFSDISGATSYAALRKDLRVALEDLAVTSILFTIDSPGGEANGCFELADAIYAARETKPVRAYVGGMGASAAYAIACACEDITCAASAELGSIGVRAGYLDVSRAMDAAGLKEWTFVSSQSPHKAFDVNVEDDRARLQVVLDDLASVFVEQVARNRDVSVEEVLEKFGKGDVMVGARAVAAGLADRLGDFESLVSEMNNFMQQPDVHRVAAKGHRMTTKTGTPAAATSASMQTEQCDACGSKMTGNSYCQGCYDDEDDDEEECKALGLDAKATRKDRIERMSSLVKFEELARGAISAAPHLTSGEVVGKIAAGFSALTDLSAVRAELATVAAEGIKRDLRSTLEAGIAAKKLSLGAIQKSIPMVLRGEQKKAWSESMDKLEAVTPQSVIDAACSVAITADDLTAIGEFAKSSVPIAAEPFVEPARDAVGESAELDELSQKIKAAADAARKTLDRGSKAAPTK
jgi:ClpP class serine protease